MKIKQLTNFKKVKKYQALHASLVVSPDNTAKWKAILKWCKHKQIYRVCKFVRKRFLVKVAASVVVRKFYFIADVESLGIGHIVSIFLNVKESFGKQFYFSKLAYPLCNIYNMHFPEGVDDESFRKQFYFLKFVDP